jgi:hypothetical protein
MNSSIPLQSVALALPEPDHPILRIRPADSETIFQFAITHDQLLLLNKQTADLLLMRKLHE